MAVEGPPPGGGEANTKRVSGGRTSPRKNPSRKCASKNRQPGRRKNAALYELLGAVSLYAFCVFAPGLLGAVVRFYEDTLGDVSGLHIVKSYRHVMEEPAEPPAAAPLQYDERGGKGRAPKSQGRKAGGAVTEEITSGDRAEDKKATHRRSSSYLDWASLYLCGSSMLLSETGMCQSGSSGSSSFVGEAPGVSSEGGQKEPYDEQPSASDRIRLMLYGGGFWSDVELIAFLSMWLATVRVLLIHLLVPRYLAEPKRLAAMVRCKSSHLLSGQSYQFSPVRPVRSVRGSLKRKLVNKRGSEGSGDSFVIGDDLQQALLFAPNLLEDDDEEEVTKPPLGISQQQVQAQPRPEPESESQSADEPPSSPSSYVRSALRSTRSSFHRALGHEEASHYGDDDIPVDKPSRASMFSAPRRATAVFRFLYCSTSCLMAYGMFHSADFWPVQVGGRLTSSTRNCWDLSGGVALGWIDKTTGFELDRDFDQRNAALRLFFLAQGSYQLHSLCFHVMSMALLFLYGEKGKGNKEGGASRRGSAIVGEGRLVSMKSSMKSYVKPLLEHVVSLGLVFGAYIFSSLRRLGAVGIFTLEVSSAFLQLLQMCVNAPEGSRLRNPKFLRFFHRFVVVPTFVYCRFVVLPFVVWHSAAFESQAWLDQIERAFVTGAAITVYVFFNGLLAFIFGLNVIHFRRLLFHPHLKQLFAQLDEEEKEKSSLAGRRLS